MTPSSSAARCQRLCVAARAAGAGAVSARNCSTAPTTAAASLSEPVSVSSVMRGLRGWRSPFLRHRSGL